MYQNIHNIETVPLLLSVSDIKHYDPNDLFFPYSKSFSNNVGTIKSCVTDITWNVDLKALLGDLYDKYDYFTLELLQFMTIPFSGSPVQWAKPFSNHVNIGYRNLSVYISGLDWVNSSYSQKDDANLNYCHLSNVTDHFSLNNNVRYDIFEDNEYMYESPKGYAKYDLLFEKQQYAKINIRLGSIDSGLDFAQESVFINSQNIMHYFTMKFNIIPFK
jgi:hypothetical protein